MNGFLRRFSAAVLVCALFISSFALSISVSAAKDETSVQSTLSFDFNRDNTYSKFLLKYKDKVHPSREIKIEGESASDYKKGTKVSDNFAGTKALVIDRDSDIISWEFNVPEEGLYNLSTRYFALEGFSGDVQFDIRINGELQYNNAGSITLFRTWKDSGKITRDTRDNDLRPRQIEDPVWNESIFMDSEGLIVEPLYFYFVKGKNVITIQSKKDGFALDYIKIFNQPNPLSYREVLSTYGSYNKAKNFYSTIQAEEPYQKSTPLLHGIYEKDVMTVPYHHSKIRLNTIGGTNWAMNGQWASWRFEVPEDGLYQIGLREKQSFLRGFFTTRRVYIDGEIPFKEMNNVKFNYSPEWKVQLLGGEEPYLFYLEKGVHEIKMEVTLGDMAETLKIIQEQVFELNDIYRRIIMITGTVPDVYRDYYLTEDIPDLLPRLTKSNEILKAEVAKVEEMVNSKGSEISSVLQLIHHIDIMIEDPDMIAKSLEQFKSKTSGMAAWVLNVTRQPLQIDYLFIKSEDKSQPKATANFIQKLVHEVKAYVSSYFEDYNSIGDIADEDTKPVEIWIGTGRDQAQIIKTMIDDSFTKETGIQANLNLVPGAGILMQAILAGREPDIALNIRRGDPVNLAMRGALVDLSGFADFGDVTQRYFEQAIIPYKYLDSYYALPETQDFMVMFYRKDILNELGLEPPQTWDDLYNALPVIQRNNLQVGMAYEEVDAQELLSSGMGDRSLFPTLLMQKDLQIYNESFTTTTFEKEEAIASFGDWTSFYTDFNLPLIYNFYNRFRTGEMPLGIQRFGLYNLLSVAAPELNNLWDMSPLPGTIDKNGQINRSTGAGGHACVILKGTDKKEQSWELLKWWTRADIQARFGRELEAIIGPAARYNTANVEAFTMLPWSVKEQKILLEQWEWVKELPEIPGGYYTQRNVDNAFRGVVFDSDNPRESLYDYNMKINEEIQRKRLEFGLD